MKSQGYQIIYKDFGTGYQGGQAKAIFYNTTTSYLDIEASTDNVTWYLVQSNVTNNTYYNLPALSKNQTQYVRGVLKGNTTSTSELATLYITDELSDSVPPTYSGATYNQTVLGLSTLFSIQYNDDTVLHPNGQYIFSTNNTGIWVNDTAVNFATTPQWANVTKALNSTLQTIVGYRWYAKDNAGNWNNTPIYTLRVNKAGKWNLWGMDYNSSRTLSEINTSINNAGYCDATELVYINPQTQVQYTYTCGQTGNQSVVVNQGEGVWSFLVVDINRLRVW
jgi:hypothetical protein